MDINKCGGWYIMDGMWWMLMNMVDNIWWMMLNVLWMLVNICG